MKRIFLLLMLGAITLYADNPVEKGNMVCRTKQQDLELRDWITGIQLEAQGARSNLLGAEKSNGEVKDSLIKANKKADELQIQINGIVKERDDAIAAKAKIEKKYYFLKMGACLLLAAFFFLLIQHFKLFSLIPQPYGLFIQAGTPVIIFAIFWFIL